MSAPVEAQLANSGWQSPHHLVGSPHMSSSYSSFLHLVFKRQDKENVTVLQIYSKGLCGFQKILLMNASQISHGSWWKKKKSGAFRWMVMSEYKRGLLGLGKRYEHYLQPLLLHFGVE